MRATVRRCEEGTTTAEAALVIPTLVLFAVAMAWLVGLGVAQVRATDAARETARSVARGDPPGEASALGRRVAGAGAQVSVARGSRISVRVVRPVRGPGGVLGFLPQVRIHAEAVAVPEPGTDGSAGVPGLGGGP